MDSQKKTAQYFVQNLDDQLKNIKSFAHEILNSQAVVNLSRAYNTEDMELQSQRETRLMSGVYQQCTTLKLAENI